MDKKVQHILNLFADCVAEIKQILEKHTSKLDIHEKWMEEQDKLLADCYKEIRELRQRLVDDGK